MAAPGNPTKPSPLPKACENCRIRKIRCNRANPCSNCSNSAIECRPSARQTEHRPRMIVSNHYEKQVERIHERLVGIELALRSFSTTQTSSTPQTHSSLSSSQPASSSTPSQFEGDSSFQYQSVRATEVAQSMNTGNDGDLSNAINTLKDIITARDDSRLTAHSMYFTSSEDRTAGPRMDVLPAAFVIELLARMKEKYPICFYSYSLPNDGHLERLCQRAYFPTDSMSLGEMTTMYGMLWHIIQEYIVFGDPITKQFDCENLLSMCEKNFHRGIETYSLMAEPSYDNAFALMLGAAKAQDEGKVTLCWSLSSAAARHLQALGYHRESTLKNDEPALAEKKRHLFWSVYGIEKNMSLNLGRASNIPDWDVDLKMFEPSSDPSIRPWNMGTIIFIKLAQVQGEIYEQLYSASASRKTNAQRAEAIESMSQKLDSIYRDFRQVDLGTASHKELFEMFYEASDVIYYSILTLLHRGAYNPDSGTEISSKCFEAAKSCLRSHLHYFPMFTQFGEAVTIGYVNWVLVYCYFTPFIVVFLHAIASVSPEDVKLLQDMTASLEPVKGVSDVLRRLHAVCRIFARVATVMVQHQTAAQPQLAVGATAAAANTAAAATAATTASSTSVNLTTMPQLGSYDQQTDSLFFPGFTGHQNFDPHHQLPDIFIQGNSIDPRTAGSGLNDMSAYFGNWVSSNHPSMDYLGLDFGNHIS